MTEIQNLARGLPDWVAHGDAQLTADIHGKKFYLQVVVQTLDRLFGGKGADAWLQKFRDAPLPPPADMRDLLDWIAVQIP